jgi:LPS-assembly lipoprotein
MKLSPLFKCIFLLSVFLLSSCGFHLRDSSHLPAQLRVVYIKTSTPYSGFGCDIRKNFCALGMRVTSNPQCARVTLNILSERFKENRVTISATSLLSQYLLSYEVIYQIEDAKGCILAPQRLITINRAYTVNANQILGADNELPLLRQDMRREAVYQLINQLNSCCVLSMARSVRR